MRILIASDSYKESLSSLEVAQTIKKAFKKSMSDVKVSIQPLADGGEGFVQTMSYRGKKNIHEVTVHDPLNRKIVVNYVSLNQGCAIIEMAKASGLDLLKEGEKNPMKTSTFGLGQLLEDARKKGFKKIILGIGSSATNDAGIGMLQAMGVKFLNEKRKAFFATVENMEQIAFIDDSILNKRYKNIKIEVACDVTNKLCGKKGASYVFAAQKGANKKMIELLEKKLKGFAKVCEKHFNKKYHKIEGSGAAGGVGFALLAFTKAQLKSGIDIVMAQNKIEQKIKKVDLVITGEGRVDAQSVDGKAICGLAKLCKKSNTPLIVIAGCTAKGYEKLYKKGVTAVFDITPSALNLEELFAKSKENLFLTSKNIAEVLKLKL